MYNMKIEDSFIQIRDKLQREGVKLWLPPYYNSSTGLNEEALTVSIWTAIFPLNNRLFQRLAEDYSVSLKLEHKLCYDTLQKLLHNALEKLTQINRFKESGLATIKIKVLQQNINTKLITKEVSLNILGSDLKAIVYEEIRVPLERLVVQAYMYVEGSIFHQSF